MAMIDFYKSCRGTCLAAAVVLFVTAAGCDLHKDQEEFIRDALGVPDGITKVGADGQQIGPGDPDDWRISPNFGSVVEVFPATPNPALTSDTIQIQVYVTGIEAINGLALFLYNPDNINDHHPLEQLPGAINEPVSIIFNASELSVFQGPSAVGIHRVLLYDGQFNLISYGDIKVE